MIASTQITNTEILAFIAVLVFTLLTVKFCLLTEEKIETINSRLLFKKVAYFLGKLLGNYK